MSGKKKRHKKFVAQARSTMLFDNLAAGLEQIAATRAEAEEHGSPMPAEVRSQILAIRQLLHDDGMPWDRIDTTPGLEPPELMESM